MQTTVNRPQSAHAAIRDGETLSGLRKRVDDLQAALDAVDQALLTGIATEAELDRTDDDDDEIWSIELAHNFLREAALKAAQVCLTVISPYR